MNKIFLAAGVLVLAAIGIRAQTQIIPYFIVDVPAVTITVPAPYPCNLSPGGGPGWVYAVCLTGPETHYTCSDKYRILLTDEEGNKHCINFGTIASLFNNKSTYYTTNSGGK